MQHLLSKNEVLWRKLFARLKRVDQVADRYSQGQLSKSDHLPYYKEIAFFVHAINSQEESREMLNRLLNYASRLNDDQDYKKAIDIYNTTVRDLAIKISTIPHFEDYALMGGQFPNPYLFPPLLSVKDLLRRLETYDLRHRTEDTFVRAGNIAIRGILTDIFHTQGGDGMDIFLSELQKLDDAQEVINYYGHFESEYTGAKAVKNLYNIYLALNPIKSATEILSSDGDVDRFSVYSHINKGLNFTAETDQVEDLRSDCHRVMDYLEETLNSQLTIELYIERFITYFSLYYQGTYKKNLAETSLQHDFEQFLFTAGYYPISQNVMNNGRLDTIAVDRKFAFLFEFKQFDLGKTREYIKDLPTKLANAQVQSSIYFDGLKAYPGLHHHVFIILFTNRKIFFKDNVDRLIKNGITYIFKTIVVYHKTASLVDKPAEVAVTDFFKSDSDASS